MRSARTIALALLAAILSIVLAACGSSGSGNHADKPEHPGRTGQSATSETSKTASPGKDTPKTTATATQPANNTLPDVCAKVPATTVSKIMGHAFTGENTDAGGSHACAYTPKAVGPIIMLIVFSDEPGHPHWKELTHKIYRPAHFSNVTDSSAYKPGSYTILKGDLIIDIAMVIEDPDDDGRIKLLAQYAADNL